MSDYDRYLEAGGEPTIPAATAALVRFDMTVRCPECSRVFNLTEEDDADEWAYGHDCEVE